MKLLFKYDNNPNSTTLQFKFKRKRNMGGSNKLSGKRKAIPKNYKKKHSKFSRLFKIVKETIIIVRSYMEFFNSLIILFSIFFPINLH